MKWKGYSDESIYNYLQSICTQLDPLNFWFLRSRAIRLYWYVSVSFRFTLCMFTHDFKFALVTIDNKIIAELTWLSKYTDKSYLIKVSAIHSTVKATTTYLIRFQTICFCIIAMYKSVHCCRAFQMNFNWAF